ncbi:uncharacterized protein LOC127750109 [Frankliniella occidentalis]|uniref:Uncharacterized protein LOC113216151 n=1 Tax=Frankliniella occidentalis TaxID=133901 RepID=A0A6J1TDV6_FRAOC|nr:uncharacterized protein LOC113216151 [Frankliniella occidentalis]XP_052126633.1 uncharacterized protein LOC127750109 [Frankliniella occidentalis]
MASNYPGLSDHTLNSVAHLTNEEIAQMLCWNVDPVKITCAEPLSDAVVDVPTSPEPKVPKAKRKCTRVVKNPILPATRTTKNPISSAAKKKRVSKDKSMSLKACRSEARVASVFKSIGDICVKMAQICNESTSS